MLCRDMHLSYRETTVYHAACSRLLFLWSKYFCYLIFLLHAPLDLVLGPLSCVCIIQICSDFMQVLSGDFLKSYKKDIINIHHGLLPSFKGSNPSKQVPFLSPFLQVAIFLFLSTEL